MVKRELSACLFVAWALVAVPTLCSAGALEHACPCTQSSRSTHESDCDNDPCGSLTTATHRPSDEVAAVVSCGPACPSSIMFEAIQAPVFSAVVDPETQPPRPSLSYWPSDAPLLI